MPALGHTCLNGLFTAATPSNRTSSVLFGRGGELFMSASPEMRIGTLANVSSTLS
eukprot:CAMPEP_0113932070 /NCGR_PEP_ID=MMETSP1159-20121227/6901_1 /TAXON_ID=88271 /ORGANISM="Picocystis salinarum" /LENGTH=54 /DNA_ID=CAMNT_0000933123 /DNA_START=93 /DNA_END=254 /DNA_ORIENTATION=- /assembly_acc=CAM_ASM_000767